MNALTPLFAHHKDYYLQQIRASFPDPKVLFNRKKHVLLYGIHNLTPGFIQKLQKEHIRIAAIISPDHSQSRQTIAGIRILSLKEARSLYHDSPVILTELENQTHSVSILKKSHFRLVYPLPHLQLIYPKLFIRPEYKGLFDSLFTRSNQEDLIELYELVAGHDSKQCVKDLIMYRLTLDVGYLEKTRSFTSAYMEKRLLAHTNHEIIVDCGSYQGDAVKELLQSVNNRYQIVYCFEPDRTNYKKMSQYLESNDSLKIILSGKALYKSSGEMCFDERGDATSRLDVKNGSMEVDTISLDEYFNTSVAPTVINIDTPANNADILGGAASLIKNYKPKLIVSCYHDYADLWRIPLLIKRLNEQYRIYIRHYSDTIFGTWCIAV